MLKKIFEGFITVMMWIGMQIATLVVGWLISLHIYYAVDDWIYDDDAWVSGLLLVMLNIGVSLWKMVKKRTRTTKV